MTKEMKEEEPVFGGRDRLGGGDVPKGGEAQTKYMRKIQTSETWS
jgi:hypothetical protein